MTGTPGRRAWLLRAAAIAAAPAAAAASGSAGDEHAGVRRGRALVFPRDHGAHPETRTEWWYVTGWLGDFAAPSHGFQVTFFRSRTGLEGAGRFAPRQLLFAHAALSDLRAGRHAHAQRIVRWSGDPQAPVAAAAQHDAALRIGRWTLVHADGRWTMQIGDDALRLELDARRTQPVLLQGDAGFSRKGPEERQASHYYSEPQLAVGGRIGAGTPVAGRGWLDHEWSEEILHPQAVGWDWIGINLEDGGALTAFRLRRADGQPLWSGGSWRDAGGALRVFGDGELRFVPGRRWRSPATAADYPVQWAVETPAGRFTVRALLDAQELDGRRSTGTVYWEGLSELLDAGGRRVGLGYLEMTGYAGVLRLGG